MSDSKLRFVCVDDYEEEAKHRLDHNALDYYRSGADEELTLRANREAFRQLRIMPRFLRDVSNVQMSLDMFGATFTCPIGVSPSAMHKLAHAQGELATAEGVSSLGASIMILSTLSTTSIEDLANKFPHLTKWFQLYLFTDRNESLKLVQRAERAGFKAIVLTVDAPRFGLRRRDIRNEFKVEPGFLANFEQTTAKGLQNLDYIDASITWKDVAWLCEVSSLPVLVKGILAPEDAQLALDYGARGVIVSNHGGRQLDSVPASIEALPGIVRAVNARCPVLIDGGVRTGTDIFKCLARGASMVFVGRPVLWGLAVNGAQGVAHVLDILKRELELAMSLSGCAKLQDITSNMVIHEQKLWSQL